MAAASRARLRPRCAPSSPYRCHHALSHGDWQPRNWIGDNGAFAVIDVGRADWQPAATDRTRLDAQQLRGRPDLRKAFLDGDDDHPRTSRSSRRDRLREAIGTAVRAHLVRDEEFEHRGHRMITDVLGTRR